MGPCPPRSWCSGRAAIGKTDSHVKIAHHAAVAAVRPLGQVPHSPQYLMHATLLETARHTQPV